MRGDEGTCWCDPVRVALPLRAAGATTAHRPKAFVRSSTPHSPARRTQAVAMSEDGLSERAWDRPLTSQEKEQVRRSTRQSFIILMVAMIVLTLVLVGSVLLAHRQHPDKPLRPVLLIVAIGLPLIWTFLIMAAMRLRSRRAGYRHLVLLRDRAATRRVNRQLRRGEDVASDDREIAKAIVDGLREQRIVLLFVAAAAALEIVLTLVTAFVEYGRPNYAHRMTLQTTTTVLIVACALVLWHTYRRIIASADRQHLRSDS